MYNNLGKRIEQYEQTAIENMISEDDGLITFNNDYISKVIDIAFTNKKLGTLGKYMCQPSEKIY